MVFVRRHPIDCVTAVALVMLWILFFVGVVHAEDLAIVRNGVAEIVGKPQCPDPGVKCKILYLNESEERLLAGQNGILDTAAQARALDLGQFAVYLKTKIGIAPQGEVKPVEGENK